MKDKSQNGQVVIILLLVVLVALAVALSVIGRSLNDISTSTKIEDSTRAFSAAEAGIEEALKQGFATESSSLSLTSFSNQATASVNIYPIPVANTALEYPKIGKANFAEFWLADPSLDADNNGIPDASYTQSSFNLYFGIPQSYTGSALDDQPAVEVRVFYYDASKSPPDIEASTQFYDSSSTRTSGASSNRFTPCTPNIPGYPVLVNDGSSSDSFYCKVGISGYRSSGGSYPILVRVRMLYSNISHPVAVEPVGGSLPNQVNIYRSVGTVNNIQREIEVFRQKYVMPHYFDYTLFSASYIKK
ncbi:MAG: hypothetical protein M1142_00830 [Patescibacteria group bacterium]|nr:hypothetical protein [Patescibacteria group bacterium]